MPDFRLKVFHAVATHLSFTKAAAQLYITQPAVTKNIHEIELELDIRLFERKGNQIRLTPAGLILLSHTEKILQIYQDIEFDFSVLKQKFSGQLNLGASTTIAQYVLPAVLAKFYQQFPQTKLSLLNDNTANIEAALLNHKIELGIVEGRTKSRTLKYQPFLKDELVAVVHSKSKLAKSDRMDLPTLTKTPLVFRERGSGTLEVIEHELSKNKIKLSDLDVVMYLGSTESIKSFLENANCMGFVSIRAVEREIARGELKIMEIENFKIHRTFEFVYLHGKSDGLADLFIDFALQVYNQKL
jgi:LysR family transcriptional regulator, transcriptional activator of the cysJI operon